MKVFAIGIGTMLLAGCQMPQFSASNIKEVIYGYPAPVYTVNTRVQQCTDVVKQNNRVRITCQ